MSPADALIADGDAQRAEAVRAELARHGHRVEIVDDASSVLAALADDAIRLLVLAPSVGDEPVDQLLSRLRSSADLGAVVIVVAGTADELTDELTRAVVGLGAADVWELPSPVKAADVRLRLILAEFYARLQADHVRIGGEFAILRSALDLTGTGFVLSDPGLEDNPIVYVNQAFVEMTGYPPEEILGRNCRFLQRGVNEPAAVARMREGIRDHRPVAVTLKNTRRDGTVFDNEVHIAPVRDDAGNVVRFVGVQIDVSDYRVDRADRLAMAEGSRRLAEAALRRTHFLSQASPRLDATLDRRAALDALALLAVPALGTACVVLSVEGETIRRDSFAGSDGDLQAALDALPTVRTAEEDDPVLKASRGGEPLVLEPSEVGRILHGASDGDGPLAGYRGVAVPLPARGRTVGVLVVLGHHGLDGEDTALARDLASRAGLAVDNARLYEEQRQVAEQLQRETLPERPLVIPRARVATRYRAGGAGMHVGGDFFDAFPAEDGATLVTIGDVTGKGAPAAAMATVARSTLRTAGLYEVTPSALLRTLNLTLLRHRAQTDRGRFVSAAACRIGVDDDVGLRASVCLGGHPPPVVQRADGAAETVGRRGTLLGFTPEPRLHESDVVLAPGDRLVFYTDGLSEALDGGLEHEDDAERVAAVVGERRDVALDALADRLLAAATSGRRVDDVAICVVEVEPV